MQPLKCISTNFHSRPSHKRCPRLRFTSLNWHTARHQLHDWLIDYDYLPNVNLTKATKFCVLRKSIQRVKCISADLWPRPAAATWLICPTELWSVGFSSVGDCKDVVAETANGKSSRILDDDRELVRGRVSGRPTSEIKPSLSSWNVTSITPGFTAHINSSANNKRIKCP